MKTRLIKFNELKINPIMATIFRRLTKLELSLCEQFITENDSLSVDQFATALNRWYLDKPDKPKHLTDMWALILGANS